MSGNRGVLPQAEGLCSPIYVDDLVDAVLLAMTREEAVGGEFNISGAEVVTWNDYFRQMNDVLHPRADANGWKAGNDFEHRPGEEGIHQVFEVQASSALGGVIHQDQSEFR